MKVDSKRCPQNHPCPAIRVCATKAISQSGMGLPQIDQSKCTNCGKCVSFCPMRAINK